MDLTWGIFEIPEPKTEHRFHPTRKWAFDYAWPERLVAVEIEGAIWSHGRHTRGAGFTKDMEKYNAAGLLGWRVFRFSPSDLKKGVAQAFMLEVLGRKE